MDDGFASCRRRGWSYLLKLKEAVEEVVEEVVEAPVVEEVEAG